jgi:hypothetical protein
VGAVNERLGEVEFPTLDEIVGECLQDALQHFVLDPALESSEACRIRRIPARHVCPRGAGPKDPQNAVEYIARISPWASAAVFTYLRDGEKMFDCCPLLISEVHLDLRSQSCGAVDLSEKPI